MLIPIRCFSCGKPVGQLWEEYKKRTVKGEKAEKVLDSLDVERYCCRRMLISHCDFIDTILQYKRKGA